MKKVIVFCIVLTAFANAPHLLRAFSSDPLAPQISSLELDELAVFDKYFFHDSTKGKNASLANLANTLRNRPNDTAYIVAQSDSTKTLCRNVSELQFALDELVGSLRADRKRIFLIDGGVGASASVEFYLVPKGARFPVGLFEYKINDILKPVRE